MGFCFKEKNGGMSLLEVLLAVAVFAIGIGTVVHLYLGSHYGSMHSVEKNQALLLAREGVEAVRSVRDGDFDDVFGKKSISRTESTAANWNDNHEIENLEASGDDLVLEKDVEENYLASGHRISNALSLNTIKDVESSSIEWSSSEPADTSIDIYTAINESLNTAPTSWTAATSGSSISGITAEDDLTGKYLWVKQELSTTNSSATPQLHSLTVSIDE